MATIEIESELTGTVWSLAVDLGARVDEDDPVIMVESMKMEIPICAPKAGTITEIRVASGDAVANGQVVAILET